MEERYDYLIVGGGMVADSAARGIRERDETGTIAILGDEPTPPFPRPALSKKLWTDDDFTVDNTDPRTADDTGADVHLNTTVTAIDPAAHTVTTGAGDTVGYGRLLVATGGHPRHVDGLPPGPRVLYFRTLTDYRRLRGLAHDRPHVAVVGGGFIGTEIASALVGEGCRVTLLHGEDVLGGAVFPAPLAARFEALFADAGVELRAAVQVRGGREDDDGVVLDLGDGETLAVDAVVLGLGIVPAGEVAADVLDRADDGAIVVDERLATSAADVYAAGDVAQYPDRILGRRRVEHVDNATTMGTVAGRVLAGSEETYDHTPMFYSDVLGHGYEAVGDLDASLHTAEDPVGDDGAVVVYYADDDAVRGVLLWDHFSDTGTDAARELLATHDRPTDLADLRGRVR